MSYFTPEQKLEDLIWHGDKFVFETCKDLSKGIVYRPNYTNFKFSPEDMSFLARDTAWFILYFKDQIYPFLNGFSGFDTISWTLNTNSNVETPMSRELKLAIALEEEYLRLSDRDAFGHPTNRSQYPDVITYLKTGISPARYNWSDLMHDVKEDFETICLDYDIKE